MKRFTYLTIGLMACTAAVFTSCSDDEGAAPTVNMEGLNFQAVPGAGEIVLSWNLPDDTECDYLRLEYYDPREKEDKIVNLSNYPDDPDNPLETRTYTVENTRARYGAVYNFKLTAYKGNTPGGAVELTGIASGAAESFTKYKEVKINLTTESEKANIWAKDDNGAKPLSNICDGITNETENLYHTLDGAGRHYIDIDLGKDITRFKIITWNSNKHAGPTAGVPDKVDLYRVGSLGDENADMTTPFYTYEPTNTAKGEMNEFTYPALEEEALSEPVRYLRYEGHSQTTNDYWNMAELEIYEIIYEVTDPEVDEVPIYDAPAETE